MSLHIESTDEALEELKKQRTKTLAAAISVSVLGVALIAIIIGIDKYDLLGLGGAQSQLSVEGDEDDDF